MENQVLNLKQDMNKSYEKISHLLQIPQNKPIPLGPKKNRPNTEKVREVANKVKTELGRIQKQLDNLRTLIEENVLSDKNPSGFLLGGLDEYTAHLKLNTVKLEIMFAKDYKMWERTSDKLSVAKIDQEEKEMRQAVAQQRLLDEIFTPDQT